MISAKLRIICEISGHLAGKVAGFLCEKSLKMEEFVVNLQ